MPAWAWKITMVWRTRRADVEGTLVDGLGPVQLSVVEQHPAEPGMEGSGEAAEQRLVGGDRRFERRDRCGVVAGALVEVGDHAEAYRVHDRSVEALEALGGGPIVPLGGVEVAVDDGQLGQRVRARRSGERIVGRLAVEVEQDPAPTARLVEITPHGGLLGVERVGQAHPCDVAVAFEDLQRRGQIVIAVLAGTGEEVEQPTAGQRQGERALVGLTPAGEGVVEPAPTLGHHARQPVRPGGAAGDEQRRLGVVVGDGPVERRAEVVVLGVDRRQPRPLGVTGERGCALRARDGVVPGHRVPDAHRVTPFGEPLPAVLGERLQQGEAHAAGHRDGDHQRLVDQRPKMVGDVGGGDLVVGAHHFGRRQVAAAGEHREPFEDALLVVEQELVAPIDDGTQRLLSGQGRARPARQQAEPIVEPRGDLGERERPGTGRRQLDRQRQPVEPSADLGDDTRRRPARSARQPPGHE